MPRFVFTFQPKRVKLLFVPSKHILTDQILFAYFFYTWFEHHKYLHREILVFLNAGQINYELFKKFIIMAKCIINLSLVETFFFCKDII